MCTACPRRCAPVGHLQERQGPAVKFYDGQFRNTWAVRLVVTHLSAFRKGPLLRVVYSVISVCALGYLPRNASALVSFAGGGGRASLQNDMYGA
jgi:hypothetical protein